MGGKGSEITALKVATLSCLAYSHFCLFLHLKKHLASQKFHEDKAVKTKSMPCLHAQRQFYDFRKQKIIPRLG